MTCLSFNRGCGSYFSANKDKLFLFRLCKSCLEVSSAPLAVQTNIVRPRKFEIVG